MKSFDSIYIINLHGDITKDKVTIDNNKEENVFDITKGVSINIFVKNSLHNTNCSKLFYKDIYGTREQKYQLLDSIFNIKNYFQQNLTICLCLQLLAQTIYITLELTLMCYFQKILLVLLQWQMNF